MNFLTSKKMVWIIIAVIILVAIILFATHRQRWKRNLADLAIEQYQLWDHGNVKESQSKVQSFLSQYWNASGAPDYGASQAWSAAFISWLFKTAGAGEKFPYSTAHSTYIRRAVANRKAGIKKGALVGYRREEYAPKVGDLICYPRQSGVDFDSDYTYKSHCDVVVDVDRSGQIITTIGGNVSDSVEKTLYKTDAKGRIADPKVHAVLSNKI